MTIATTKPAPPRPANMTREEAETVTKQIKENFDSLGNMLLAARDQKAYKALGYRSFEAYCQNEFGKSSSTAYQAIEDAKVRSQLEAHISKNYGEEVTLKFPSSHLKPLKAVEDIDDKLKAITYAQKLAATEGKKPTKQHLEIAVFQVSGKRSEDFKSAIQKLGFTKGVQIETISPLKKDRGTVINVDKAGLIYVELYYGSNKAIPFRPTELRILTNGEKPTNPLEGSVASKGDRVLIYAEGLQGKQGTIYTWKEGKTTLVMVDGETSPTVIAYAEMELLKAEKKDTNWEADLSWDTSKQTYYYFQKEDKIYSRQWPAGLSLTPYSHELSPIDFMADWEDKFAGSLLETLANPANLKTLVLAQAIELPEQQGQEFVADLIASLLQLFPQQINDAAELLQENKRLREQLAEAEAAIEAIVNTACTASPMVSAEVSEFLLENTAEISSPGEAAPGSEFLLENTAEMPSPAIITSEISEADKEIITAKRQGIEEKLETRKQELQQTKAEKKIQKIRADINILVSQLKDIDDFTTFRIGDSVIRKIFPNKKGIVNRLNVSNTGLLTAWVTWPQEYEGEPNSPEQHNIGTLTNLSSVNRNSPHKFDLDLGSEIR